MSRSALLKDRGHRRWTFKGVTPSDLHFVRAAHGQLSRGCFRGAPAVTGRGESVPEPTGQHASSLRPAPVRLPPPPKRGRSASQSPNTSASPAPVASSQPPSDYSISRSGTGDEMCPSPGSQDSRLSRSPCLPGCASRCPSWDLLSPPELSPGLSSACSLHGFVPSQSFKCRPQAVHA